MLKKMIGVLLLVLAPFAATASERGTADEALAMLDRVLALYESEGIEAVAAAVMDKSNSQFHDRDLYVFISEIDGDLIAHGTNPALVGRDLNNLKDATGRLFVTEMNDLVRDHGEGWIDYTWANPQTKKLEQKSTRVVRFGEKYYAAVGIYKG